MRKKKTTANTTHPFSTNFCFLFCIPTSFFAAKKVFSLPRACSLPFYIFLVFSARATSIHALFICKFIFFFFSKNEAQKKTMKEKLQTKNLSVISFLFIGIKPTFSFKEKQKKQNQLNLLLLTKTTKVFSSLCERFQQTF